MNLRRKARVAGVFYLLNIVTILVAVFLSRGTSADVLAHETALRARFALELFSTACSIVVAALLYELFEPVNRSVSLVAAFFRLVACAVAPVNYLLELAPLRIASGPPISGMRPEESQAIALLLHRLHGTASDIVIVFFAFYGLLIGYLIFNSTFLPRIIGVLFCVEGVMALSVLVPPLARHLFPYFVAVGLLCEVSLTFCLLVKPFPKLGVDGVSQRV
jgi:uncharacterized protein DUF4386